MTDNPYVAPAYSSAPGPTPDGPWRELLFISRCQKLGLLLWAVNVLLLPGLVYLLVPIDIYIHDAYFVSISPHVELWAPFVFFILFCPVWLLTILLVAVFTTRVFNPFLGMLFGMLSIIPGAALLLIPVTSRGATHLLRISGVEVGLFGADLREIQASLTLVENVPDMESPSSRI